MTKKIILSASILAVAVLIAGAILMIGSSPVEAAKNSGGDASPGCVRICTPYIEPNGTWGSFCVVDCPNSI